jgi:hypothetical protein
MLEILVKKTMFPKVVLHPSSGKIMEPALLGPLAAVNLYPWIRDKITFYFVLFYS